MIASPPRVATRVIPSLFEGHTLLFNRTPRLLNFSGRLDNHSDRSHPEIARQYLDKPRIVTGVRAPPLRTYPHGESPCRPAFRRLRRLSGCPKRQRRSIKNRKRQGPSPNPSRGIRQRFGILLLTLFIARGHRCRSPTHSGSDAESLWKTTTGATPQLRRRRAKVWKPRD
jgi:hypothetical protein